MKAIKSLLLILFLGSPAWALDLPKGEFKYTNTEVVMTKHFHRLYNRSSKEREMIEVYRTEGYSCNKKNASITECSKKIATNPHQIEFKTTELALLSPTFSNQIKGVREVSASDLVTIYEIDQDNNLSSRENTDYTVYDIASTGFYVDLQVSNSRSIRFDFINSEQMSTFSFEKERLSKREYFRHSLFSFYAK